MCRIRLLKMNYLEKFKLEVTLLIGTILTFLTPLYGLFGLIAFAVILDTLFAMYSVVKLQGWAKLVSTKFFNLAVKTFFYMGTIILAYLIDTHIFENQIMGINLLLSKSTCVVWTIIEAKSIDETSQKLGNRPFLVIVKGIISKVKEFKKDLNDIKE